MEVATSGAESFRGDSLVNGCQRTTGCTESNKSVLLGDDTSSHGEQVAAEAVQAAPEAQSGCETHQQHPMSNAPPPPLPPRFPIIIAHAYFLGDTTSMVDGPALFGSGRSVTDGKASRSEQACEANRSVSKGAGETRNRTIEGRGLDTSGAGKRVGGGLRSEASARKGCKTGKVVERTSKTRSEKPSMAPKAKVEAAFPAAAPNDLPPPLPPRPESHDMFASYPCDHRQRANLVIPCLENVVWSPCEALSDAKRQENMQAAMQSLQSPTAPPPPLPPKVKRDRDEKTGRGSPQPRIASQNPARGAARANGAVVVPGNRPPSLKRASPIQECGAEEGCVDVARAQASQQPSTKSDTPPPSKEHANRARTGSSGGRAQLRAKEAKKKKKKKKKKPLPPIPPFPPIPD